MGIKQLYNDNLQKLPNEYGDVSIMHVSVENFKKSHLVTQPAFSFSAVF